MIGHKKIRKLLSAFLDGQLTEKEKLVVDAHLKECASCQKEIQELKKLSSLLKAWSDENPSPDLEQRFENKFQARKKEGFKMKTNIKTRKVAGVLVVMLLCVVVTQKYLQRGMVCQLRGATDDISSSRLLTNWEEAKKSNNVTTMPNVVAGVKTKARFVTVAGQYEPYYARSISDQKKSIGLAQKGLVLNELGSARSDLSGGVNGRLMKRDRSMSYSAGATYGLALNHVQPMPIVIEESEIYRGESFNREGYNRIYENEFLKSADNPLSTFSIDVDTASYSNLRRFLTSNQMPPQDSVRIEEMINYFSYDYPQPKGDDPFSVNLEGSVCPWNPDHSLVSIGLQGKSLDSENLPPSNLVFLIDVSGSMSQPNKLPLLKNAFKMLVQQLGDNERVAIVTYAGNAGLVLDSTKGSDKQKILNAIEYLQPGGSTAGGAGISLAYKIAKDHFIKDGNNRVILATDGDFNVGVSSDGELIRLIEEKRKDGVFLTVLGFGTGNYQDAKMEQLANKGNGNFYYIDTIKEANKVLVKELGSTLFTIAKDVKLQIEFNPAFVKAYRLIGYENRILAKEDFNDDTKDAGELGAGHTVTALYEIVPADSVEEFGNVDDLKYQQTKVNASSEVLTVKLRYKKPDSDKSQLIEQPLKKEDFDQISSSANLQFSAAVAEFGLLLRNSEHKAKASYSNVLNNAKAAKGKDAYGYRQEFIELVEVAESLDNTSSGGIQFKGQLDQKIAE
ncbi:MAG: von Willebrand factor type A domain-containing protein [Candidatus Omnitrophica bacterium]|nr:von Willebrand factor type A domain-containing protein [Candidatus Omnitrophota bacterium]